MDRKFPLQRALSAGFCGGLTVVGFYFFADLIRLEPLLTPSALSATLVFPAVEHPYLHWAVLPASFLWFGERLLLLTVAHFLAFALLGVVAVALFRAAGLRMNILTGAMFGVVVCSLVFLATYSIANDQVVRGTPSAASVLLANALAGMAMGAYVRLSERRAAAREQARR